MSKFKELLEAVKDEKLTLEQVEKYRDELVHLHSDMQIDLADIEKKEALYFLTYATPDVSDISVKRKWKATDEGQRQILLNRYIKVVVKEVDSLKSRVYRLI